MFFSKLHRYFPQSRTLLPAILLMLAMPMANAQSGEGLMLPELGDSESALASHEQEYKLGQSWLRLYRSRVPESRDELMYDYLNQLIKQLASHSALEDKRLELIVVTNPTLNAFAVPGGIVGVHTGIFLYAGSEQQLAGVLSHELAHLSQRHWVRSMEKQKENAIPTMAGLLAGLALLAVTGSDAGVATIMATQAANLESRLRFSRENEAEADRIGMQTMVNADMDPRAIPAMFESMQRSTRFAGERPPEFLLSHPVTEKRISDSRNRAEQYPQKQYAENADFQLMKARARLSVAENPSVAARMFQNELNGETRQPDASRYGLALAQIAQRQFDEAEKTLKPLLAKSPEKLPFQLAQIEIMLGQQKHTEALALVQGIQAREPRNYPATVLSAHILESMKEYKKAIKQLEGLPMEYRSIPSVWYDLAELRGLAGDKGGVHLARAEYYILNGIFDKARQQLTYALQFYEHDYLQSSRIKERLRELAVIEEQSMAI